MPVIEALDSTGRGKIILSADASGNLKVAVTGAGSGGTSSVDQAAFSAGVSAGTPLMAEDPGTGKLVIVQTASNTRQLLTQTTIAPIQSNTSSAPAQQTVGTTAGSILAANANRKRLRIQNTGTTRIKLGFGQTPTQTAYHVCLPACGSADDGTSPPLIDEVWTGAVNAISSLAGGTVVVEEDT